MTQNPDYAAEQVAFDLTVDPAPYLSMSLDQIMAVMKQKKDNPFIFIRSNKMPILLPLDLVADGILPKKIDEAALRVRAALIRSNADFCKVVATAAEQRRDTLSLSKYIEKQTYHPIPADIEEKIVQWRKQFYHADWQQRAALVHDFESAFSQELKREPFIVRFQKFGQRILFDNAPRFLSDDELAYLRAAVANRVLSTDGPKEMVTIPHALAEIEDIKQKFEAGKVDYLAPDEGRRITDLENYYRDLGRRYEADKVGHPGLHFETI
ncbi:MAG: hypothetical protein LRY36_00580 [Alphaproteobacteria bacterium]|nr:hypothetical protein [Alphaproteobacteria bacterium]